MGGEAPVKWRDRLRPVRANPGGTMCREIPLPAPLVRKVRNAFQLVSLKNHQENTSLSQVLKNI